MTKLARLIFLLICGVLLAFGILRERHTLHLLDERPPQPISGAAFVEGTTFDAYMLKDSQLYDVRSLSKTSAGIKDCKT